MWLGYEVLVSNYMVDNGVLKSNSFVQYLRDYD